MSKLADEIEQECNTPLGAYSARGLFYGHWREIVTALRAAEQPSQEPAADVFTPEQIKHLNMFQRSGAMHPFTCRNRSDGRHFDNGGDLGMLVPTVRGWICQCCDYTQNWAHDFMMNGEAIKNHAMALQSASDKTVIRAAEQPSREANAALKAELAEVILDRNEADSTRERLGVLLTQIAYILKGVPEDGSLHDWADLPLLTRKLKTELAEATEKLPCGHLKCFDDSYGGCAICSLLSNEIEADAEIERLNAELADKLTGGKDEQAGVEWERLNPNVPLEDDPVYKEGVKLERELAVAKAVEVTVGSRNDMPSTARITPMRRKGDCY